MEITNLVVILALGTMLALIVFALVSKHKADARRQDPDAPKSTLAADKRSDGKPVDV
jgi:hypothetical protein